THEYLYLLDNPANTGTSISEITALSNTTFLVDERDGNYAPAGYKKLFMIDISAATDVGPASTVAGSAYDGAKGLLIGGIGGTTLEKLVKNHPTATAAATLATNHITPVAKSLFLDVSNLLQTIDPTGAFYSHDKLEGVTLLPGGKLVISND